MRLFGCCSRESESSCLSILSLKEQRPLQFLQYQAKVLMLTNGKQQENREGGPGGCVGIHEQRVLSMRTRITSQGVSQGIL